MHVPSEYPTIQAAIDNAAMNDAILVDSGTYSGDGFRDLQIGGTDIWIIGVYGAEKTRIDLFGESLVVDSCGYSHPNSRLRLWHLTITGGSPAVQTGCHLDVVPEWCIFRENSTAFSNPWRDNWSWVYDCDFIDNDTAVLLGGDNSFNGILACKFIGNTFGVYLNSCDDGAVMRNTFIQNQTAICVRNQLGQSVTISQNVIYQNTNGFSVFLGGSDFNFRCNNILGNFENYVGFPDQTGINGNIAEDPIYCDTTFESLTISSTSPLLPANNSCEEYIGSIFEIACYCGDADISGGVDVIDILFLVAYLFQSGPAPDPLEAGNINGLGDTDILDVLFLVQYLFQSGPAPPC